MNPDEIAIAIVALNSGELGGKTRLQKTAYLLEACGMNSGLEFEYHYYGPYSFALAQGWEVAQLAKRLDVEPAPGRHGVPYMIFRSHGPKPEQIGALGRKDAERILQALKAEPDAVVELGATLHFLQRAGFKDPERELKQRKPLTATPERLERARQLLAGLPLKESERKASATAELF